MFRIAIKKNVVIDSTEMTRPHSEVFSELSFIRRSLLHGRDWSLDCGLKQAFRFLMEATPRSVLEYMIRDVDRREAILKIVTGLDHLGYVTFQTPRGNLSEAAQSAGFCGGSRWFTSEIVSRELGHLTGTGIIPTEIFKAFGVSAAGRPIAVEVFVPTGLPAETARQYVERGNGIHIGFTVTTDDHLQDVSAIMQDEGFRHPDFAEKLPLFSSSENMNVLYLDHDPVRHGLRIEFCHYQ